MRLTLHANLSALEPYGEITGRFFKPLCAGGFFKPPQNRYVEITVTVSTKRKDKTYDDNMEIEAEAAKATAPAGRG